jgi:hypothetical protein
MRSALLGDPQPLQLDFGDRSVTVDPVEARYRDFNRVLDMQKVPALTPLLAIVDAAAAMRTRVPDAALIGKLQTAAAALPSLVPGKEMKLLPHEKDLLAEYETGGLEKAVAQTVQKAAKKKPNPKDFEKLADDLLAELQPQFTLALSGLVYGRYLRPWDLAVSGDPYLLRKHRYFDAIATTIPTFNTPSAFQRESEGAGSYFLGGFAAFASAAGEAATIGMKAGKGVPDSVLAAQIAAVRDTDWAQLRETDQRLFSLRVQLGREWIASAAGKPEARARLASNTAGLLSPVRHSELLSGIDASAWTRVWNAVTVSDLYSLGLRCLDQCSAETLQSPLGVRSRAEGERAGDDRLNQYGPVPSGLLGCSHPHLLHAAPYEEYEHHMFPTDIAERSAEMKMQLALAADQAGISPAALGVIAEPLLRDVLARAEMSGAFDWRSLLNACSTIDGKRVEAKFEEAAGR